MRAYLKPELLTEAFDVEDVITTSGGGVTPIEDPTDPTTPVEPITDPTDPAITTEPFKAPDEELIEMAAPVNVIVDFN